MESCFAVGKEEEKLSKKYKAFREHTEASLEDTLKHLSSLREELSKGAKILHFIVGTLGSMDNELVFVYKNSNI